MNLARPAGPLRQSRLTISGHMTHSRHIARPEIASSTRCSESFREVADRTADCFFNVEEHWKMLLLDVPR